MSNVLKFRKVTPEPEEIEADHESTDGDVWVETGYSRRHPGNLPAAESVTIPDDEWDGDPIEAIERCPGVLPWGYGDGSDLPF